MHLRKNIGTYIRNTFTCSSRIVIHDIDITVVLDSLILPYYIMYDTTYVSEILSQPLAHTVFSRHAIVNNLYSPLSGVELHR